MGGQHVGPALADEEQVGLGGLLHPEQVIGVRPLQGYGLGVPEPGPAVQPPSLHQQSGPVLHGPGLSAHVMAEAQQAAFQGQSDAALVEAS